MNNQGTSQALEPLFPKAPNEVFAMTAKCRLFEESRSESVKEKMFPNGVNTTCITRVVFIGLKMLQVKMEGKKVRREKKVAKEKREEGSKREREREEKKLAKERVKERGTACYR